MRTTRPRPPSSARTSWSAIYIYSLVLGMSVPDVSGKAIANLEVESLKHVAPTFHGDTIYAETLVLDKTESKSKDDRGIVYVETKGYNQDGTLVCIFRRKVMVPKRSYGEARGGEQPGRPVLREADRYAHDQGERDAPGGRGSRPGREVGRPGPAGRPSGRRARRWRPRARRRRRSRSSRRCRSGRGGPGRRACRR